MSEADKIIENLKKSGRKVEEFYTGNKTSDKNVAKIEDDVKILDKFCEYESSVVLIDGALIEVQEAIVNILAELEQKDKRIQEIEEEKAMLKKASNIAKEVNIEDITDVINESCKEFMSNYIPKQAAIEALEDIKDYFDRLNGPDEDIEYIRQVKEELLETK